MRRDLQNNLVPAGPNKWTFAVDAINQLTTNFSGQIRWGLILFPDTVNPNCQQDAPAVSLGDGNEGAIQTLLNAALNQTDPNFPFGPCVTNIDTAVEQASIQPELTPPLGLPSYAVLITDGKQAGCSAAGGDNGTEMILGTMNGNGVSTFVVGFGGAIDPAQMDEFAVAGGVPRMGSPSYYQADDAVQLEQALGQIAGSIVGCSFTLASDPPNADDIFVFFDNQSVPRDPSHTNGWDYDPSTNQITFYGTACDDLKASTVADVDVVFGCDQPTPE